MEKDAENVDPAGLLRCLNIANSDYTSISTPKDHRTYLDIGATLHVFHSMASFVFESMVSCALRTVLLADRSSFIANICGELIISFNNATIRLKEVFIYLASDIIWCLSVALQKLESFLSFLQVQLSHGMLLVELLLIVDIVIMIHFCTHSIVQSPCQVSMLCHILTMLYCGFDGWHI